MPVVYIALTAKVALCACVFASGVLFLAGARTPSDFARVVLWTVGVAVVSFLAGFFGPVWFGPESPQGPLLGIFITGPVGAAVGSVIGLLLSMRQVRHHSTATT